MDVGACCQESDAHIQAATVCCVERRELAGTGTAYAVNLDPCCQQHVTRITMAPGTPKELIVVLVVIVQGRQITMCMR